MSEAESVAEPETVRPGARVETGATQAPQTWRDVLLSRLDTISFAISLVGVMTIAVAGVLVVRMASNAANPDLFLPTVALLLLSSAAMIGHFVVIALARQRYHERLAAMRDAAHEMGHGDLNATVPEGDDDLGLVGRSLNAMATRMGRLLKAQSDLLSGVSHELRSPIARIDVALELISMASGDEQEKQELIETIREETALLERHISRLLEAQRVSTQRVLLTRKPLLLDALIGRVMAREKRRLNKLGWRVQIVLGLGDAEVLGDENALDRALSTLVENAIQHATPLAGDTRTPELTIETVVDDNRGALVSIKDRGPGLTSDQCGRVFAPFFRIDQSRSTKTGGTGLGLYLARKICEAHRGTARAWPRDGGGLVVQLRIPLRGQKVLKETLRVEMDADSLRKLAGN